MAEERSRRHKVIGTIISIKGQCGHGHKVGDALELSMHNTAGLCGLFYHDIFPWILALEIGGENPWGNKDIVELECMDRTNSVRISLRRVK